MLTRDMCQEGLCSSGAAEVHFSGCVSRFGLAVRH